MRRSDLIIAVVALAGAAACNDNRKLLNEAKHSLYDAEFAQVYSAALDATRSLYPNIEENAGPGKIATAWHQVQYANCAGNGAQCDDVTQGLQNPQVLAQSQGLGQGGAAMQALQNGVSGAAQAGMPTRLAYKKYFVRFDVAVLGGRPWRVKVTGHASAWDPGAEQPQELHGSERPAWLDGRSAALQVAIYKRVKQFAVPMPDETTDKPDADAIKTDPSQFANVPIGAAKLLAQVKDAIARRDYGGMRPLLADDVIWSLGGGAGIDSAMAMWQADPTTFDAMAAALPTCVPQGQKIACPATAPPGTWQLVLETHADVWKIASFVRTE